MKESILYVYAKDNKIKVHEFRQAWIEHKLLLKQGWVHTATLNASTFIQYLHNECKDIEKAVKELSIKKSE